MVEVNHHVSKTATELFWKVALKFFPKLRSAAETQKTYQFKTIRKKLYEEKVPNIFMEIGYKNRSTGEVEVVHDASTPVKQFPPNQYEKLYEIATLKVSPDRFL